jgi:glutamyl-tRNA synthetase
LFNWLYARHNGGTLVLRIEDTDLERSTPEMVEGILVGLRWLGIDWDEGPDVGGPSATYRQSERTPQYDAAVDALLATGRAYLCACSRADVARAATAPHADDEEGPRYPGTCRELGAPAVIDRAAAQGRKPCVRFAGGGAGVAFVDGVRGPVAAAPVDDFVLRRADGVASYHLAVVVDDAAMGIQQVVRGDDLLTSTPRQIALGQALGLAVPAFAHVPLVLSPGGERLAKRTRPASLASLRQRGLPPEVVVGVLAASAGLGEVGARMTARALVATFALVRLSREAVVLDEGALPTIVI